MTSGLRVALVGPGQQGNLALDYLAAAAEADGHTATVVRFDTRRDLARCTDEVLTLRPDLIGLGIAFQYSIEDYLELARTLRQRGYKGHLTCGGHVPTFCFRELLTESSAIDTAVRHEGEETLQEMLACLTRGQTPSEIQGLVWREDGDIRAGPVRAPVRDLDTLPLPKRHPKPYVVAGFPTAFVIASRGCIGECAYCSIRAFSRAAGGPPYRMRNPDKVADELTHLYFELGVRVVVVQDDLFILTNEKATVGRLRALSKALERRGVDDMVFWVKGRPEAVTPRVVDAAKRLGVAHLFLGVENASHERLRYLGRLHSPEDNERALELCRGAGIQTSFNSMLFDPDCTMEDVETNLDFLEAHADITWNICRTEVYSGTELHRTLEAEARLVGDYKTYGYTMLDESAEIMFRILRVCFYERSFDCNSILNKLITLSFANKIQQTLIPGKNAEVTGKQIDRLVLRIYRDTVNELRRIKAFAESTRIEALEANRELAVERAMAINEQNHIWMAEIDDISDLLDARGARTRLAPGVLT